MTDVESYPSGCEQKMDDLRLADSQEDESGDHGNVENLPPPKTLKDLIAGLHQIFASDKINVDFVKSYMASYKSNRKEWKPFAKFDPYRYTRNLIDAGNGKFNLMLLCWNEAQGSSIHSHADAHCFLKVLDGGVREQLFDWPTQSGEDEPMHLMRDNEYGRDQVTYINDDIGLHRVENPSHSDKAVTLHVYSPPFQECKVFDEKSGHENTSKVTFWSKFGHRTPFAKTGKDDTFEPENN